MMPSIGNNMMPHHISSLLSGFEICITQRPGHSQILFARDENLRYPERALPQIRWDIDSIGSVVNKFSFFVSM